MIVCDPSRSDMSVVDGEIMQQRKRRTVLWKPQKWRASWRRHGPSISAESVPFETSFKIRKCLGWIAHVEIAEPCMDLRDVAVL